MLTLEHKIQLDLNSIRSPNLVGRFPQSDLVMIGEECWAGYDSDVYSRENWFRRNEAGMDLAMQLVKDKSFPWPGCANVAFPLVTIATLQFHSRAYPELIPGKDLIQYEVWGDDPDGKEAARSLRISTHMSHQCLKEDDSWEENHDKLLINYSVVGSAFIKTRRATTENKNKTEFVPARYLVMDYWAKKVETCARKTHLVPLYRNEIVERCRTGQWLDILKEPWFLVDASPDPDQGARDSQKDTRAGMQIPQSDGLTPFWFGEQHTYLDLDGDGYAEPVIVTFETTTKQVVRIVYRFERLEDITRNTKNEIIKIQPEESFTKFEFIPSPDGGIYGMGWGVLLGPLNEAASTMVNQLLDAGTMSTTAGGFLARGAKLKGGNYVFSPFQWQNVDTSGNDLKDSIFPLPVREPSEVLFKLLSLLIDYSNRITASTEMLVGENPGQNTPAATSAAMVEQGMKIFASIFKRAWRSMKQEFEKLYILNAIHSSITPPRPGFASKEDYMGDPSRIAPSADPTVLSESQRLTKAMALKQAAYTTPGYDLVAVEQNFLRAMRLPNWQTYYKGPDKVPPLPNPKMQVEQMKLQGVQLKLKQQQLEFVMGLIEDKRVNDAKILELEAQAAKLIEEAGGIKTGHAIAAFEAAIGAARSHQDAIHKQIDLMMKMTKEMLGEDQGGGVSDVARGSGDNSPSSLPPPQAGGNQGGMGAGGIHSSLN